MTHPLRLCLAAAAAALLTACGGGGSDPLDPVAGTEPSGATASVQSYTNFVRRLIADEREAESGTPLLLNATAAPVSESASPLPVN